MKIGFIVNHPTQFEVPFYQYVAKHFLNDSFDIFYLEKKADQHFDEELGQQIKWGFDLFKGYSHYFLPEADRLNAFKVYLKSEKYDLIIVNGYKNQYAGFADLCKSLKVKVALRLDTVLFNQPFYKIWLRKILLNREYKKFDHFLVTGSVSKAYIKAMGIAAHQINLFSYCVDNAFFSEPRSHAVEKLKSLYQIKYEKVILSVAKFMDRESPWDILKAFTKINNEQLVLILVGDGAERTNLESYAKQYPNLNIIFPGYINYQELPSYYQLSDIFIHAAKDEPWGVSVQEAIAGGCFVICSDKVGAVDDLIIQEKNGLTYPYGDFSALATHINYGLEVDKNLLKETNQRILRHWNYDLMWQEIAEAAI